MSTAENEPEPPKRAKKVRGAAAKPIAVQSPVRNKPRPAIIALAIALIIVSGLAAAFIYTNIGRTTLVFSAVDGIARGDVIERATLTQVEIPDNSAIPSFTSAQADSVIGKTAVVDIPAGSLISPNNIADNAGIPAGTSIVGVSLTPAQLPPYPLVNGDPVRIVDTPVTQGDPPTKTPTAIEATVVSVKVDDVSGNTVVAVSVDTPDKAANLAARAATGRVALILDARE